MLCWFSLVDFSPVVYGTVNISIQAYIGHIILAEIIKRNKLNLRSSKFSTSILFEEATTEKSGGSQSNVSILDNGFSGMQFESSSSQDQVTDIHT